MGIELIFGLLACAALSPSWAAGQYAPQYSEPAPPPPAETLQPSKQTTPSVLTPPPPPQPAAVPAYHPSDDSKPPEYSGSTPVDFKRNSTRTPPESRCPDGSPRTQGQPCPEKKNEMPQMGGAPQGGDESKGSGKGTTDQASDPGKDSADKSSSGAGKSPADSPSSSGETPGQKLSGAEGCSSPKGLRDDSERETKSGDKLGKFKNGLQPGDGTAQAPKSSEDPSGYDSELGKTGDCQPKSALGGPTGSARGQIQSSQAAFSTPPPPLVGEGIRLKRAYKLAEKAGGLVGASAAAASVKMDSTIADIHQSLTRLHQSAQALGQAGLESAGKVDEAISKADGAQTQVKNAHSQLKSQISLARSAHGQYQGFESGFNACPPMPPVDPQGTLCKQPHFGGATTSKSGYVPDPAQKAAEAAKREVDGAKAAFDAADRQLRTTEEAKQRFKAALQDAQQRVASFGTGTLELQRAQTGDGNADLRIAELRAMLASFSRYIAEKKTAYDTRFHPGFDTLGSARDQLAVMLDGRK